MQLSSSQLEAFAMVAQELSFSRAARKLGLTQPALSTRVRLLEEGLETQLFARMPGALEITEAGHKLLRYWKQKSALEQEVCSEIATKDSARLSGMARIASYSSMMNSVVVPAIAPLLRSHPGVQAELQVHDSVNLPGILKRGQADFILHFSPLEHPGVESILLGVERYVMIESSQFETRLDIYLDGSPQDPITEKFFRAQGRKTAKYRRTFMHDVQGILAGVVNGLGRAVIEERLIQSGLPVRRCGGFTPLEVEVFLSFQAQRFYPRLHQSLRDCLLGGCPKFLKAK
jgi:DNA-binding transcriptional LysR family regulator